MRILGAAAPLVIAGIVNSKKYLNELENIILKYQNFIDKIIFDNDKGIYDAFNKGIAEAEGEFIGIINSDDVYTNNALQHVVNYYRKDNRRGA